MGYSDFGRSDCSSRGSTASEPVLDTVDHLSFGWERLKHEKFLFLSEAGPYRGLLLPERLTQLAERVEEQVSTEHANWFDESRRIAASVKPEGR